MDYLKERRDFFNRMPCIVDMNMAYSSIEPKINDNDKIVQVVKPRSERMFTVYYFHRIYNDDRIYKCKARFSVLPEPVKRYMKSRKMRESSNGGYKWDGAPEPDKNNKQLSFF